MVENVENSEQTRQIVQEDTKKAKKGKNIVRAGKMPPRPIPQVVLNEARAQGGHVIYLEDSNGNRMHLIRIGRRTVSIMTERQGQEPSSPLSAKTPEVRKIVNKARVEVSSAKSDMDKIISSVEAMQKVPMQEPINQQHISVQDLKNMKDTKSVENQEISGKVDSLSRVMIVPKLKKNGELSKKNFNIQLMDADGRVFTLTKKMVKEAAKYNDSIITSNGKVVEQEKKTILKWDKYVEMAEKGQLSPEMVASFFNNYGNGPNLGAKSAKTEEKANNTPKVEPTPVKVDETVKDTALQTKIWVTGGTTYSITKGGDIEVTNVPQKVDYLIPHYDGENSSKQVYGIQMNPQKAYKDKQGMYHCGASTGGNENYAYQTEKNELNKIMNNNNVYNDLKRESSKRKLTEGENKFMKSHEKALAQRGLIRCPDGVLEYKDCPTNRYDVYTHARAQKAELEIARGTRVARREISVNNSAPAQNVMQKGNDRGNG